MQKARWWAQDYAYALYWQARSVGPTDATDFLAGSERPVVMIPGIWESWSFLRPLIEPLHAAGHPVHVLAELRRNGRPVVDTARHVAAYLAKNDLTDVVLVAHSKGGLIGKYLMADRDPQGRVDSMVAVATPFGGSRYAPFLVLKSLRAFSPRDATTLLMAKNHAVNTRITSIYASFDPHIPEGSLLPGARNVELPTGGHFRILADPTTLRHVLESAARQR
ncbi:alpha/beta hydrolase [Microbacteriaceae bacterium VKM Ac-2855]|nr:alpha/beta hydrolase [Microbacteriaceae bacterium VKM Ac-2855]